MGKGHSGGVGCYPRNPQRQDSGSYGASVDSELADEQDRNLGSSAGEPCALLSGDRCWLPARLLRSAFSSKPAARSLNNLGWRRSPVSQRVQTSGYLLPVIFEP